MLPPPLSRLDPSGTKSKLALTFSKAFCKAIFTGWSLAIPSRKRSLKWSVALPIPTEDFKLPVAVVLVIPTVDFI